MNSVIYNTNEPFDFDKLSLNPPMVISGGNYFIKYSMDGNSLYIQPPECKTRGSITQTSKRAHCDLMFSHENTKFIQWMENLETYSCQLIYENREDWFESEMDLSDIETYFATPLKIYKSGKYYLARANIPNRLGKINLKIYNENREEVDIDTIVDNTHLVTILEIQGIKCSSRSFQIEMEIKQMMTLEPVNFFDNCIISSNRNIVHQSNVLSNIPKQDLEETDKEVEEEIKDVAEVENSPKNNESVEIDTMKLYDKDAESNHVSLEELEQTEPNDVSLEETPVLENSIIVENQDPSIDDLEFTVDLEKLDTEDLVTLKPQNDIYYERYREAQKRARIAKNLALQAYLEAKEIKNQYNLDDIESEDDEFFQNSEIQEEAS